MQTFRLRETDVRFYAQGVARAGRSVAGAGTGRPSFAPSQVVLPGGAQMDLSWLRSTGPWTFNAALRNVFDRSSYGTASDTRYIPLLPGRSVGLTATYKE